MSIPLSDRFGYGKLLRFTLPSIVMLVLTSIYSVVDGIWFSAVAAEVIAVAATCLFLEEKRKQYRY